MLRSDNRTLRRVTAPIPHFRVERRTDQAIIASDPAGNAALGGSPLARRVSPMGDAKSNSVRLSFNPQLRVEFRGATVTSDAGLLLPHELDERFGLSALIERHLTDPRTGQT